MSSIECLELQNMAGCTTGVGVLKAMPRTPDFIAYD